MSSAERVARFRTRKQWEKELETKQIENKEDEEDEEE